MATVLALNVLPPVSQLKSVSTNAYDDDEFVIDGARMPACVAALLSTLGAPDSRASYAAFNVYDHNSWPRFAGGACSVDVLHVAAGDCSDEPLIRYVLEQFMTQRNTTVKFSMFEYTQLKSRRVYPRVGRNSGGSESAGSVKSSLASSAPTTLAQSTEQSFVDGIARLKQDIIRLPTADGVAMLTLPHVVLTTHEVTTFSLPFTRQALLDLNAFTFAVPLQHGGLKFASTVDICRAISGYGARLVVLSCSNGDWLAECLVRSFGVPLVVAIAGFNAPGQAATFAHALYGALRDPSVSPTSSGSPARNGITAVAVATGAGGSSSNDMSNALEAAVDSAMFASDNKNVRVFRAPDAHDAGESVLEVFDPLCPPAPLPFCASGSDGTTPRKQWPCVSVTLEGVLQVFVDVSDKTALTAATSWTVLQHVGYACGVRRAAQVAPKRKTIASGSTVDCGVAEYVMPAAAYCSATGGTVFLGAADGELFEAIAVACEEAPALALLRVVRNATDHQSLRFHCQGREGYVFALLRSTSAAAAATTVTADGCVQAPALPVPFAVQPASMSAGRGASVVLGMPTPTSDSIRVVQLDTRQPIVRAVPLLGTPASFQEMALMPAVPVTYQGLPVIDAGGQVVGMCVSSVISPAATSTSASLVHSPVSEASSVVSVSSSVIRESKSFSRGGKALLGSNGTSPQTVCCPDAHQSRQRADRMLTAAHVVAALQRAHDESAAGENRRDVSGNGGRRRFTLWGGGVLVLLACGVAAAATFSGTASDKLALLKSTTFRAIGRSLN